MIADRLAMSIEDLHRNFGAWPIAWALMKAIRRERRERNIVSHLSDRMLVDMGLPERKESPALGHPSLWNLRP